MNTYLTKKGGRIPVGSAGGHPWDEKKPRTVHRELEDEEGEPVERGTARRNPRGGGTRQLDPEVEVEC